MKIATGGARRPPRAAAAAVAAAALIALAACSSGAGSSTPASSSTPGNSSSSLGAAAAGLAYARTQVAEYTAVAPAQPIPAVPMVPDLSGKTVWYIPLGNSIPIIADTGTSMADALSHLGAKVHVCDGNLLPTTIASCMNQAASQHADAVVTAFVDYSLIPAAFNNLVSHHIPVLVGGESPTGGKTSSSSLAFFSTTPPAALSQTLAADWVIADSDGKADVVALRLTDSSSAIAVSEAGEREFAAHCPGCTVHIVNMQTAELSNVASAVSSALVSDPGADYLLVVNDSAVDVAVSGVQSAGATNRVKVVTSGASPEGLQRVATGNHLSVDVGNSVVFQGWSFANGLIRLLASAAPTSQSTGTTRIFTKQNTQALTLTPQAYTTTAWFGGNSFEQQFLTAWGAR